MNVLVTGGAGYVGSVCVEALLDAGHRVTVLDNLSEGHRSAVDLRATFVQGGLEDENQVRKVLQQAQAEAVMHFAACALVGESMSNAAKYFANNVAATITLLNAAVACRVRKIVFSSSCAVFGWPDHVPITEDSPRQPINPYGESKLLVERMLVWYRQVHGLDFAALRYFNAAGATERLGEHHRIETHLIPNVLKVALGQAPHCEIYGTDYPTPDGTCIRDYVHVADLAQAHLAALAPGKTGFFNLGNGEGYSVRQVIDTCRKVTGAPIPVVERPRRPGDPPRLVASADKARRELGWTPRFASLQQIVASAWHWHRKHPNGYPD
jgi:UDP-glucose 4-epimerase